MKLTFADPNRVAQLSDTAFGMAREPSDTGRDGLVEGRGMPYRGKENLGQGGSPVGSVWMFNHLLNIHVLHGTPDKRSGNCLVEQFRCWHAEQGRRASGMQTRSGNAGPNRESGHEGNGPGADYGRELIVDENDVNAPVWQHTMFVGTRRSRDRLTPETQEMGSQRRRREELPVF